VKLSKRGQRKEKDTENVRDTLTTGEKTMKHTNKERTTKRDFERYSIELIKIVMVVYPKQIYPLLYYKPLEKMMLRTLKSVKPF